MPPRNRRSTKIQTRETFGSKGALASADGSQRLHKRKEAISELMLRGPVEPEDIVERFGCSIEAARRELSCPRILKRLRFKMDNRIQAVCGEAMEKLIELMRGSDRKIALRASLELLDRGGFNAPKEAPIEQQPAFSLTLNLSGDQPDDNAELIEQADSEALDLDTVVLPSMEPALDTDTPNSSEYDSSRH